MNLEPDVVSSCDFEADLSVLSTIASKNFEISVEHVVSIIAD